MRDVFLHSVYVIRKGGGWRERMAMLMFYVKHRSELGAMGLPEEDEMRRVLAGETVEGWVPLEEMRERAMMYGVDL